MRTFRGLVAVAALVVVGSLGVGCSAQDPKHGCDQVVAQGGELTSAFQMASNATNLAEMAVYEEEIVAQVKKFRDIPASSDVAAIRDDLADAVDTHLEENADRRNGKEVESGTAAEIALSAKRLLELCKS